MIGGEKDPLFVEAESAWTDLKGARTHHERYWEEISNLIRPLRRGFTVADPSQDRTEQPIDSSPIIANSNFAATIYGTLTNPANRWFGLKTSDPDLADWQPMRLWLDGAAARIRASFAPSVSPFYSASTQLFADLSAFGNSAQMGERQPGEKRITDLTISMAEICFDADAFGQVVEVIRRFRLTAMQAASAFGYDALPPKLQEKADAKSRDKFVFFHHIRRNHDWRPGVAGARGKRWSSVYASEEGGAVVRRGGYDEMPITAPRWEVETGETYGLGPGWTALPEARKIALMSRANLRAGQRAADPTILAPDREVWPLQGRIRPGAVVYGGVGVNGNQMIRPLDTVSGTGLTLEMHREAVAHVRDAFHWALTNLADRTGLAPIEVAEIQAERLRQMAPHMGRVQEEFLAPKIAQRFSLLWRAGQIPPPPPEAAGADLQIDYLSAAAMAAKSAEGAAAQRIVADLAPLAALSPEKSQRIADRLDADAFVEVLHEARGGPAELLRSREQADQLAQMRAQAAQQAQALEAAERGGGVVRDLAQAEAALGGGRA